MVSMRDYAVQKGVSYALLPDFNKNARRMVKDREVISALKMYGEKAMLMQSSGLRTSRAGSTAQIKRMGVNGRSTYGEQGQYR